MNQLDAIAADFDLLGEADHSALGTVVTARHRQLDQARLLKVVPATAVFVRRARTATLVAGPGVLHVHAVHEGDGCGVLVLADDPGVSLDRLLSAGGSLPLPLAVDIAEQAMTVVHGLHREGLVHGQLTLASFSVAAADDGVGVVLSDLAQALSQPWPLWPAAERLLYSPLAEVDQHSFALRVQGDLLALSLILAELASGRRWWRGSAEAALAARLAGREPAPDLDGLGLPQAVAAIVRRGVLTAGDGRPPWPSVEAACSALRALRAELPDSDGATSLPALPRLAAVRPAPNRLAPAPDSDHRAQVAAVRAALADDGVRSAFDRVLAAGSQLPAAPGAPADAADRRAEREVDIVARAALASARSDVRRGHLRAAAVKLRRLAYLGEGDATSLLDEVEAALWRASSATAADGDAAGAPPAAGPGEGGSIADEVVAGAAPTAQPATGAVAGRPGPLRLGVTLEAHLTAAVDDHLERGDFADAWRALAVAERVVPDSVALGAARGRVEKAARDNRLDAVGALTTSARLLVAEGDHRGALAQLRRAGSVDPGNPEVRELTALTLRLHSEATIAAYLAAGAPDDAARVAAVARHRAEATDEVSESS